MGFFDFFKNKKVELTKEQIKLNKLWELWAEDKVASPYSELMTYQKGIKNGGHYQYFAKIENVSDIQKEMSQLEKILPSFLIANLRVAHYAYVKFKENNNDKYSERNLLRCDNDFFHNEEIVNNILETYACEIE